MTTTIFSGRFFALSPARRPGRRIAAGVAALLVALHVPTRPLALSAQVAAGEAGVTRAGLAAAYLRLDRIVAQQPLPDSVRVAVNRAFDRSTLAFFTGRFAEAVRTLDSLTTALAGGPVEVPATPARVVHGAPPSRVRDALLERLARLDSAGPLEQALVSARARASLLVDTPSPERGAEFLTDPSVLAPAVTAEVAALEEGRNPYARRAGDLWRAVRGPTGTLVPFRLVVPPAAAASDAPVPVVIALHGAGGDENMFVDGYGAGAAARLAGAQGALLVSPATAPLMQAVENFDLLLRQLAAEYAVDTTRVYVVGHSMGASAAARLAQQRGARLAGVACLAGGAPVTAPDAPPVLFVGAALDPIVPARRVEQAAAASREAGTRASYRELPLDGHTLMVGPALAEAIPWLFTHRR